VNHDLVQLGPGHRLKCLVLPLFYLAAVPVCMVKFGRKLRKFYNNIVFKRALFI